MHILLQHPHGENEISGVRTFVENSANTFRALGHDVRVLSTASSGSQALRNSIYWADVVHLNSSSIVCVMWCKILGKRVIQSYHFPFWGTWKETEADRALGFWASFFKSISVPWSHGHGWRNTVAFWKYFVSSVVRLLLRVICTWAVDARVTVSNFIADDSRWQPRMKVIRYPVPKSELYKDTNFFDVPEKPRFTFVGRITGVKGPWVILRAASLLLESTDRFEIYFVGDGDIRGDLERFVAENGLAGNVTFTGKVPRGEAMRIMAESTAVVVPSQWDDPSPYVVMEAAALGRAVVGSRRGGIPEIIGPGILLDTPEEVSLGNAMLDFVRNPDNAVDCGRKCYNFVCSNFDPVTVSHELLDIYH